MCTTENTKRKLNQKAIYQAVILDKALMPGASTMQKLWFFFYLSVPLSMCGIIPALLGIISWQETGSLIIGIFALFSLIAFLIVSVKHLQSERIKNLNYYITENICVDKTLRIDKETSGSIDDYDAPREHYCLLMEPHHLVESEEWYKTIEVGDHVYLLCSCEDKVLYIFNQKEWTLDTSEFNQVEGYFYFPIEGVE